MSKYRDTYDFNNQNHDGSDPFDEFHDDEQFENNPSDYMDEDAYFDDTYPTVPCLNCHAEIAEGVEMCPICSEMQIPAEQPHRRKSTFFIVMLVTCLLLAIYTGLRICLFCING